MRVPRELIFGLIDASLPHSKKDVRVFFVDDEVLTWSEPVTDK